MQKSKDKGNLAFSTTNPEVPIKIKENDGTEYEGFTDEEGKVAFTDLIPSTTHYEYQMPEGYKE